MSHTADANGGIEIPHTARVFDPPAELQNDLVATEEGLSQPPSGVGDKLQAANEAEQSHDIEAGQPSVAAAGRTSRSVSSTGERPESANTSNTEPGWVVPFSKDKVCMLNIAFLVKWKDYRIVRRISLLRVMS